MALATRVTIPSWIVLAASMISFACGQRMADIKNPEDGSSPRGASGDGGSGDSLKADSSRSPHDLRIPPPGLRMIGPNAKEFEKWKHKLGDIASRHKMSRDTLERVGKADKHLRIDDRGDLYFVDASREELAFVTGMSSSDREESDGRSHEEGLHLTSTQPELASGFLPSQVDPILTKDQVFHLNSRASSSKIILLDFDGNVTEGSAWNNSNLPTIVTPPYDKDDNPTMFSPAELAEIVAIWRAVAEDFAALDVNVTTKDPGDKALEKNGIRVAIGGNSDWLGFPAGGTARVNSFGVLNTPCFVFPKRWDKTIPRDIWELVSHEVGHTLGLLHDGVEIPGGTSAAYYAGQGTWTTIMGTGAAKTLSQFDKGEFQGANNKQDDYLVMSNFIALLPQQNGSSRDNATALTVTKDASTNITTGVATGVISQPGVADYFMFVANAGTLDLSASVLAPSGKMNRSNLDLELKLFDFSGNLMGTFNPNAAKAVAASLGVAKTSVQLPHQGVYYLSVTGAGVGDPMLDGYSDYGSRGQFELKAVFPAFDGAPPVASAAASIASGTAPLTVNFSSTGSSDPDGSIVSYRWDFGDGTTSNEANPTKIFGSGGAHPVTLTVMDNIGLKATSSLTIDVKNPVNRAPVAVAKAHITAGVAPLAVSFSSTESSDPDGTIAAYSWNFGDGTTSTEANPHRSFSAAGSYTVTLTVTDNGGTKASSSLTIHVSNPVNKAPVAVAKANVTAGTAPLAVSFSSHGSYDPDGTIKSYMWSFGDGSTSSVAHPSKTYSSTGTFTVKLTVKDHGGNTGTTSFTMTVRRRSR